MSLMMILTTQHPFLGQVTRDQMFMEFDYTLNVNEQTVHGLHKMIENVPSAIEAATVRLLSCFLK